MYTIDVKHEATQRDNDGFELLQRGTPRERVLRASDVVGDSATLTVDALGFSQSITFRVVERSAE